MDLQAALLAAVGALTGAVGVIWIEFKRQIAEAKASCEEDRRKLWELVRVVQQLERRRDSPIFDQRAPVREDEIDVPR